MAMWECSTDCTLNRVTPSRNSKLTHDYRGGRLTKGCAHAASGSLASGPAHGSGLPEWCFFLFFDLRLCFSPVGACVPAPMADHRLHDDYLKRTTPLLTMDVTYCTCEHPPTEARNELWLIAGTGI